MKFVIQRELGQLMPWWAGFCWFDERRNVAVCCPVGLNLLARIARAFWCFMLRPVRFWDAEFLTDYWRRKAVHAESQAESLRFYVKRLEAQLPAGSEKAARSFREQCGVIDE